MENIAAAIYCRLSQDDGNAGESNSIQTQKALLKQYCAENRIPIAGVYCDDGWSGTNFEVPELCWSGRCKSRTEECIPWQKRKADPCK